MSFLGRFDCEISFHNRFRFCFFYPGFASSLKGPELSRPEETTEEPSADVSISSKSDDNIDWSASPSPERTGKQDNDSEDIQIKEEGDDDDVPLQLGEGGESTTAQVQPMEETRAEAGRPQYPPQPLRREPGVTIFKPAILVPDSDTSMTQSSHSQSLSQTRHLHHLTAPNSSIEHPPSSHPSSVPPRDLRATQPPASMPPPLDRITSSSKEAFRSSTPLGHLSSSPSNAEDDDTSPDGKSISSRARGPKAKSRPSWARAMTNEEVMRRISTPLRDPKLGPSTDSSPAASGLPSANSEVSDHWNAQDIKIEQQSQVLDLPSPSPSANVLTTSRNTNVQETSKLPRVLGARTTAQRTTAQKYRDLADILSGVLRENGREG